MDLQNIFYIVGIVAMVLFIVLIAISIYLVLLVRKVIISTERKILRKIVEYTKPADVLKGLASSVAGNLLLKLRDNLGLR